jgi:hypothetical protein
MRYPEFLSKNKILISIYEWLYLDYEERNKCYYSEDGSKQRSIKIVRLRTLNSFNIDYPHSRVISSPIWNWSRIKLLFLRFLPKKKEIETEEIKPYKSSFPLIVTTDTSYHDENGTSTSVFYFKENN